MSPKVMYRGSRGLSPAPLIHLLLLTIERYKGLSTFKVKFKASWPPSVLNSEFWPLSLEAEDVTRRAGSWKRRSLLLREGSSD